MYTSFNRKKFRRQSRLNYTTMTIERMNQMIQGMANILDTYADTKNWLPPDKTKDVKNEAGLVVGVERIHTWAGPGSGPELAGFALKQISGGKEKQKGVTGEQETENQV